MADKELITKACEKWLKNHDKTDCLPLSYEAVQDLLSVLKEQDSEISRISNEYLALVGKTSKKPTVVRCKDCRFLIDHYGFMNDGYCANMRDKYSVKFKPDKDWFCTDGVAKD